MKKKQAFFSKRDYKKIRLLILSGIELKYRKNKQGKFKVWINNKSWIYVKDYNLVLAYKTMFKKLEDMGVFFQ